MMNLRLKQKVLSMMFTFLAFMAGNIYAMYIRQEAQQQLWQACEEKNLSLAQEAVVNGANVNDVRADGMTPLMVAVQAGRGGIIVLNDLNFSGRFDISRITLSLCPRLVRFLLTQGARVNAYNDSGYTALHFLAQGYSGFDEIALMLRDAGLIEARVAISAPVNTRSHAAALWDHVNELIDSLSEVNVGMPIREPREMGVLHGDMRGILEVFHAIGIGNVQGNQDDRDPHWYTNRMGLTTRLVESSTVRIDPELVRRVEFHSPLFSRPNDPAAIEVGFVGIAARVTFNAEVGNHIDPNDGCPICTDKLQCDSDERNDEGRVVQLECGHVYHASCFNNMVNALNPVQVINEQGRTVFEDDPERPGHQRGKCHVPCPLCRAPLKAKLSTIVQCPGGCD